MCRVAGVGEARCGVWHEEQEEKAPGEGEDEGGDHVGVELGLGSVGDVADVVGCQKACEPSVRSLGVGFQLGGPPVGLVSAARVAAMA